MAVDRVRCVCDRPALLGESPLWVARERALYWVDIKGRAIHRLDLAAEAHRRWPVPDMPCWLAERADQPGFVAGFRTGFATVQLDPLRIDSLGVLEPQHPGNRLNDAAVDRRGCVWAGTMDDAERAPTGSLYRLDPDGRWSRQDSGYTISNGPAFSPDHDLMYHTDSALGVIYRFEIDDVGALGERQEFVRFRDEWGAPDGMATDSLGGIWVAHWGGGRVSRFLPDGRLERSIELPVSQVTSCCFAGPDLERMFVTTAAIGREDEPQAGCLFELDPGVRGAPVYVWRG